MPRAGGERETSEDALKGGGRGSVKGLEGRGGVQKKVGRECEDRYFRQGAWCVPKHYGIKYFKNHYWFLKGLKHRV